MAKKKNNKEKQIKRLEKDIEEWQTLFRAKMNEGFFSPKNIGWLALDLFIGFALFLTIFILCELINIPNLVAFALGLIAMFWYLGEFPLAPNKYNLYNWKSGQLELDNKLLEIKLQLEALYG